MESGCLILEIRSESAHVKVLDTCSRRSPVLRTDLELLKKMTHVEGNSSILNIKYLGYIGKRTRVNPAQSIEAET